MSEQRYLFSILYKNKRFAIYTNKYHYKSFLKILDDNSLSYPDLEEYIQLDKIYNSKTISTKYFLKQLVNFTPKAITKKNRKALLIGLSSILWSSNLFSHSFATTPSNFMHLDNSYESEKIIPELKEKYGIAVERAKDGTLFIKETNNGNTIYCFEIEELRNYLDIKYPSFNQVREAIDNNGSIPQKYKQLIHEYINSIEKYNNNFDLSIFYYNIKRLKIIEKSQSEIAQETSEHTQAYFSPSDYSITIDGSREKNFLSTVFNHELEHMANIVIIKNNDQTIIKSFDLPILSEFETGSLIMSHLGIAATEGLTTNHVLENHCKTFNLESYEQFQDEMYLYSSLLKKSTEDLLNSSIKSFIDEMYDYGIYDISYSLNLMDATNQSTKSNEITIVESESTRNQIYETTISQCIDQWLKQDFPVHKVYTNVVSLLCHSYIEKNLGRSKNFDFIYSDSQNELKNKIFDNMKLQVSEFTKNNSDMPNYTR